MPKFLLVRLNVREAASQSSSIVMFKIDRGSKTVTGIWIWEHWLLISLDSVIGKAMTGAVRARASLSGNILIVLVWQIRTP